VVIVFFLTHPVVLTVQKNVGMSICLSTQVSVGVDSQAVFCMRGWCLVLQAESLRSCQTLRLSVFFLPPFFVCANIWGSTRLEHAESHVSNVES
jgi:hypothetical protein